MTTTWLVPAPFGLSRIGIHRRLRLEPARLRLRDLRAADLAARAARIRVVRHVLRLERRHRHAAPAQPRADRRRHPALAGVRRGAADEERPAPPSLRLRRRTSQTRYGPPMHAVIAPAGISAGASTTRPIASHDGEQHAAEEKRARHQHAVVGADARAHQVRHDQADEADRPGQRDGRLPASTEPDDVARSAAAAARGATRRRPTPRPPPPGSSACACRMIERQPATVTTTTNTASGR